MSAPTVAQIVAADIDELRSLPTHRELAAWGEAHELMTQARVVTSFRVGAQRNQPQPCGWG